MQPTTYHTIATRKKILVIEDNEDIRENTAEILELANYSVDTAENGKTGIERALQNKPDLIVCDIMMPELDGYGVLNIVQHNPALSNTAFIFLTAKAEGGDFRKGMGLGADDYIAKPFSGTDLLNSVESRLRKAEAIKQQAAPGIEGVNELLQLTSGKEALQTFVDGRNIDRYKKKQTIYTEGNHPVRLFYVQKGKVKIFVTNDDGKELVVALHGEGDFFGYTAMLEETTYKDNASAIEDAEIAIIPKQEFEELMYTNRDVAKKFIKLLAKDVAEKEQLLLNIAYNSLRKKVADVLVSVYDKYGSEKKDFTINISRENLAAVAGTATESLIRTLSDFKNEKLIEIKDGTIAITNLNKLKMMRN